MAVSEHTAGNGGIIRSVAIEADLSGIVTLQDHQIVTGGAFNIVQYGGKSIVTKAVRYTYIRPLIIIQSSYTCLVLLWTGLMLQCSPAGGRSQWLLLAQTQHHHRCSPSAFCKVSALVQRCRMVRYYHYATDKWDH